MSDPDDARDWLLSVEDMIEFGQRVAGWRRSARVNARCCSLLRV